MPTAFGSTKVPLGDHALSVSIPTSKSGVGVPSLPSFNTIESPLSHDQKATAETLVLATTSPTFWAVSLSSNVGYSSVNVASRADRSSPAITGNHPRFWGVDAAVISFWSSCLVMSSSGSVVGAYGPDLRGYSVKVLTAHACTVWLVVRSINHHSVGFAIISSMSSIASVMSSVCFATSLMLIISPASKSSGLSVYVFVPALSSCTQKSAHLTTVKMFHTLFVQSAISLLVTTGTLEIIDTFSIVT